MSAGKLQRDPATGKAKRDPATGKLRRNTATTTTCCCEPASCECDTNAIPSSVTISYTFTTEEGDTCSRTDTLSKQPFQCAYLLSPDFECPVGVPGPSRAIQLLFDPSDCTYQADVQSIGTGFGNTSVRTEKKYGLNPLGSYVDGPLGSGGAQLFDVTVS